MKYLIALLVLSIVIIVHEFGHYVVAKISGVKVVEFSIGMGPRIVKFKRKDTMYSLKLFLFGGSCQMLGADENEDSEGSYNSVSVWKRIAIVIAGPLFNFILAFVFSVFLIGKMGYDPAIIYNVTEGSPAEEAGLQTGDRIVKVNGKNINFYGDYTLYMYDHNGSTLNITYVRDGEKHTVTVAPRTEKVYQMGISMDAEKPIILGIEKGSPAEEAGIKINDKILSINDTEISATNDVSPIVRSSGGADLSVKVERDGNTETITFAPKEVEQTIYGFNLSDARVKCSPAGTIKYSFKQVGYWIKAVFKSLGMIFRGKVTLDDFAGPVGIVTTIGNVVEESKSDGAFYVLINVINWMIMISANLGVMNLLPIPAVDGGKLVFLGIEAITKKPVPKEKEGMVHFVGAILLLIFTLIILFNDVLKIFGR